MGTNIHIPAEDVWKFFQKNKKRLSEEMVAIAENEDTEYAVYLTEDNGYPLFSVCKGKSDSEFEEGAINELDCTETAKRCYVRYLFPVVVTKDNITKFSELDDDEDEPMSEQDRQDAMYEREDELQLAMADFLQVVLQEGSDGTDIIDMYGPDMIDELLDIVLEHIAADLCLPVYRPMFFIDEETGEEIYEEYPYGDPPEVFDDDDDDEGGQK